MLRWKFELFWLNPFFRTDQTSFWEKAEEKLTLCFLQAYQQQSFNGYFEWKNFMIVELFSNLKDSIIL